MQTSPVKMATPSKSNYGTPITPAEVGTPMSAASTLPTSPPERNVYIDSSSTENSSSPPSKKEPKLEPSSPTSTSATSPTANTGTSPFIHQGSSENNDLALSSNSENPTYVASPQNLTIGQSSALSTSPNSSALASSPHLASSSPQWRHYSWKRHLAVTYDVIAPARQHKNDISSIFHHFYTCYYTQKKCLSSIVPKK